MISIYEIVRQLRTIVLPRLYDAAGIEDQINDFLTVGEPGHVVEYLLGLAAENGIQLPAEIVGAIKSRYQDDFVLLELFDDIIVDDSSAA